MVAAIRNRDLAGALRIVKERNPFPMTCGRVCPHPCETICRRNIADGGVAIGHLERYVGEWERGTGRHIPLECAPFTGRRIAIVGAGPAGLSCAYFLRRLGHQPIVYESRPEPGGMLRYGIPEYRLPRSVVAWEIEGILRLGVQVRTEATLGKDFSLKDLSEQGFEAVFLATGAWTVPHLCVPGEYAEGVVASLDFLTSASTRRPSLSKKQVAVIGESNTAMDCARICIRLGAKSVTVICPTARKEMTARKRDVERAEEEGVRILFGTSPVRVLLGPDGAAASLEFVELGLESAEETRMELQNREPGTRQIISSNLIVIAYERKPDLEVFEKAGAGYPLFFTQEATLASQEGSLLAAAPNIFAGGDLRTGRATVVGAVAEGRHGANTIHHLLAFGKFPSEENLLRRVNPKSILKNVTVAHLVPKATVSELPVWMRVRSFIEEVEGPLSEEQAGNEAYRCLRCGTYCYDRSPESFRAVL
jgi:formate dehydrogenase beta subunit